MLIPGIFYAYLRIRNKFFLVQLSAVSFALPVWWTFWSQDLYTKDLLLKETFRDESLLIRMASIIIIGSLIILALAGDMEKLIRRKMFHFMAVAVFIPALQKNWRMIIFAFNCNIAVFIWVEIFRKAFKKDAFSALVDRIFDNFVDAREQGYMVTTHT